MRAASTNRTHLLATPPSSQEPEEKIVDEQDRDSSHGSEAATATSGELPCTAQNTPDSQTVRKTRPVTKRWSHPEVLVHGSVHVEAASSPTLSPTSSPSKRASTAKVIMIRQRRQHDQAVISPSGSTVLVPQTDLDITPESFEHRRNKSPSPSDTSKDENSSRCFHVQRHLFTKTLQESNAHVGHLRRTNVFQAQELLREKQARQLAEAEVAGAGARAKAERQAEFKMMQEENRMLRTTLIAVVMALVAYVLWCQVNAAGFKYIRQAEKRRYGL